MSKKCVISISGGLDSTIALRQCVEEYDEVIALSFFYGQKQQIELEKASESTKILGVEHHIIDISFLNMISKGFSSNVDPDMEMPTILDVLGDPSPSTMVPNRNLILASICAAFAETKGITDVIMGIQSHDSYGYWDTTPEFIERLNNLLSLNRKTQIRIMCPFASMSKKDEIEALLQLDGNLDLLSHTITCYNPNDKGESCGKCPSCSERISNFKKLGLIDPIPYSIDIPWMS